MTRVAYLISSARLLLLDDGSMHPVGTLADEVLRVHERFTSAGLEVTVITPDGQAPTPTQNEMSWFFRSSEADTQYLSSVVRTLAPNAEDIRVTLGQYKDLDLAATRHVDALLRACGQTATEAHQTVSAAVRASLQESRSLALVLADDGSLRLTLEQIRDAVDEQRAESQRLADERWDELEASPAFRTPVALPSLTVADIDKFDGLFVTGGYGSMTDLADNADAGRVVAALHRRSVPIAALGHGAAVLLSAPERADGLWLFDGFRMTSITDDEEDQTEIGRLGMAWRLDVALKNAGGVFDDGPAAWAPHVVVDRHLITGQNPASCEATVDAMVRRLGIYAVPHRSESPSSSLAGSDASTAVTPSEAVSAFLDALAHRDIDAAVALVAPRVAVTVHPLLVDGTGADTLREVLSDLVHGFADLRTTVHRVIVTGSVVTALLRVGGTQSADYAGAINLHKRMDLEQAWRFEVADGKIAEVSVYWCQAQLYRRLAVNRYDTISIA